METEFNFREIYDIIFINLFPITSTEELEKLFNMTKSMIFKKARKLGLKKDLAYSNKRRSEKMTGKHISEEAKSKLREKFLGKKMSEETKNKIKATQIKNNSIRRGENHYNWKGGNSKRIDRFEDPRYNEWRNLVLERDGYRCQKCQKQFGRSEIGIHAHHIKSYKEFPDRRFDVDNGITLCKPCHMLLHGKKVKIFPPIPCACGCGILIPPFSKYTGKPQRYADHHYNTKLKPKPPEYYANLRELRKKQNE
jgi:hypothetical protein